MVALPNDDIEAFWSYSPEMLIESPMMRAAEWDRVSELIGTVKLDISDMSDLALAPSIDLKLPLARSA